MSWESVAPMTYVTRVLPNRPLGNLQLRVTQSLLVLALLSGLVVHVATGGGSSGKVGGATDSMGRAGLRAQSALTVALSTVVAQIASTTEEMVRHLGQLTLDDAAATVGMTEAALAADVMVEMDNEKSAAMMELVCSKRGALIMAERPAELAVGLVSSGYGLIRRSRSSLTHTLGTDAELTLRRPLTQEISGGDDAFTLP